ncbi:hypothetical protein [Cryobacterium sp. GrIS_2_6]|uniref:hypothetical protein n=1 Tax=Cryobacterium sp. GrIS_2_6 TaxID=3162785 RepID=UPI0034DD97AE
MRAQVGDKAFFAGTRLWLNRYKGATATTVDFEAVMEKTSGQPLNTFFDEWLRQDLRPAMSQLQAQPRRPRAARPRGRPHPTSTRATIQQGPQRRSLTSGYFRKQRSGMVRATCPDACSPARAVSTKPLVASATARNTARNSKTRSWPTSARSTSRA